MKACERLTYVLDRVPLTQREFAHRIGYDESHLSAVKAGKSRLTPKMAGQIERTLGISAAWLLNGSGEMHVAEPEAIYRIGTDPRPGVSSQAVGPFWECGSCFRKVGLGIDRCPHCGVRILWEGEEKP